MKRYAPVLIGLPMITIAFSGGCTSGKSPHAKETIRVSMYNDSCFLK